MRKSTSRFRWLKPNSMVSTSRQKSSRQSTKGNQCSEEPKYDGGGEGKKHLETKSSKDEANDYWLPEWRLANVVKTSCRNTITKSWPRKPEKTRPRVLQDGWRCHQHFATGASQWHIWASNQSPRRHHSVSRGITRPTDWNDGESWWIWKRVTPTTRNRVIQW